MTHKQSAEEQVDALPEMEEILKEAEPLIAVTTLSKHNTNREAYRRFLEGANENNFERAESVKGTTKAATKDDVLDWLEKSKKRFQEMFFNDARRNLSSRKLDSFYETVTTYWADGKGKRLESPEMQALFASIKGYYKDFAHTSRIDRLLTLVEVDESVSPLLSSSEVAHLMQCNRQVLDPFIDEYIESESASYFNLNTPGDIWVHRGLNLETPLQNNTYVEIRCLNAWSIALSVAEQFSQAGKHNYRANLSAPLLDVWDRLLFFSPFIPGFPGSQYELGIVPDWVEIAVSDDGVHFGVHEYELKRPYFA